MLKLVADANCEGHLTALVNLARRSEWREVFELLDVHVYRFADFGLAGNSIDRVVWNTVQFHDALLITDNRNMEDADSLQATINDSNTLSSLPVITFSDIQRFKKDREYAAKTLDKLMDYLVDLIDYRGSGRLFIP
ncbi:MAG TPA: hypothetical protein VKX17_12295 [Planctomycetota bacterium]|nr:hypothetical protein [Planctomycetota bacterium]